MKRHTETAESQSSYTNFAFLPYGEWASEFEKGGNSSHYCGQAGSACGYG